MAESRQTDFKKLVERETEEGLGLKTRLFKSVIA